LIVGVVAALVAKWTKHPVLRTGMFATLVVASHGLLDTLTDGGRGRRAVLAIRPHALLRPVAPDSRVADRARLSVAVRNVVAVTELLLFFAAAVVRAAIE
jgi:hypothetical protein